MIDPMLNKLSQVVYHERLQEAAEARRYAAEAPTPGVFARLQQAFGRRLDTKHEPVQAPASRSYSAR